VGNIYVADTYNNRVQVFFGSGDYMTTIGGSWGSQVDQFRYPTGVDIDIEGNVYIADMHNHRVQKFAPGTLVFLSVVRLNQP
jgi:DNA-binding beta-propeller fold protein YncE